MRPVAQRRRRHDIARPGRSKYPSAPDMWRVSCAVDADVYSGDALGGETDASDVKPFLARVTTPVSSAACAVARDALTIGSSGDRPSQT